MAIALLAALASCAPPGGPAPAPSPRYFLGEPYRMGGLWSYPREEFGLRQTGIAEIVPEPRPLRLSSSGYVFLARGMFAAHRTLQLPAVVAVTNLETGRTVRLRVVERGPEAPGRVVGVSARAAELLGARGPFQARVEVEGEASRLALAGLPGLPEGARVAAAPVGRVEREALAPPPGARGGAPGPAAEGGARRPAADPALAPPASGAAAPPLPEVAESGTPAPGRLMLEGSTFFRRDLAERQAARIRGGRAEPAGPRGPQQPWRVVAGPFAALAEADAALAQALAAGLQELRLVVE